MKYYESKGFKKLEKEWYERLKKSGFEDVETEANEKKVLKQRANNGYRQATKEEIENKREYFTLLAQYVQEEQWDSEIDKFIMTMRSEGKKLQEISDILKKTNKNISRHVRTLRFIIRRYENKWNIKTWTNRQMNKK